MDEEERQEKHQRQTNELYCAIGKFAVKFEQVCHNMQNGIVVILLRNGLKNERLGDALLSGVTADPLRKAFGALIKEALKDHADATDAMIVDYILKRVQELTETRNDVIHRTWFIGWASPSDTDFSLASGSKIKHGKKGVDFSLREYKVEDFDKFSAQADEISGLVNRLYVAVATGISLSKNFAIDSNGRVTIIGSAQGRIRI